MLTFNNVQTYTVVDCANCGLSFGITTDFEQRRRNDHTGFYCPKGHLNYYNAKSDAEKLRDQLAAKEREVLAAKSRAETERQWRLDAEAGTRAVQRSLRATKAVVTRTKRKIVAGRCPCCSHQFKDLKSHMTTRHPKYDPDKAAAALESKAE